MKKLFLFLMVVAIGSTAFAQKEVGGIMLPATQQFDNQTLVLNGAGVREKLWIDLYAAGLYLNERTNNSAEVLTSKEPVALRLHIVSRLITSNKMIDAVTEGFEKSTGGKTAPIQDGIDTMIGFFKEDIKRDDIFDLVYLPSKNATAAYKNGKLAGMVEGKAFKTALFGIWLSNRPVDDGLKKDLLAGK